MTKIDWIALDWGTTNFRAWALGSKGELLDQRKSDQGMLKLKPEDYEPLLLKTCGDWLGADSNLVIGCGMAGAKGSWFETPYRSLPCSALPKLTLVPTQRANLTVYLCSGLKQDDPADVMRGEETQVAGLLSGDPDFSGLVCIPGTHSKWIKLDRQRIIFFRTFMSGEFYKLIVEQSIIKKHLRLTDLRAEKQTKEQFEKGFLRSFYQPATFLNDIFAVRAQLLLRKSPQSGLAAYLSGLVIGLEFSGVKSYWHDIAEPVCLIATDALAKHYLQAFKILKMSAKLLAADELVLEGLKAARLKLLEQASLP